MTFCVCRPHCGPVWSPPDFASQGGPGLWVFGAVLLGGIFFDYSTKAVHVEQKNTTSEIKYFGIQVTRAGCTMPYFSIFDNTHSEIKYLGIHTIVSKKQVNIF